MICSSTEFIDYEFTVQLHKHSAVPTQRISGDAKMDFVVLGSE